MLFKKITHTVNALSVEFIAAERKTKLNSLVDYIQTKTDHRQPVRLNFICTHNSRRSPLAQVWAQAAAHHYRVTNTWCYSGGTTATALFPAALQALQSAGFEVTLLSKAENSIHAIKFSENEHPVIGFSKRFDHSFNPNQEFAAIMTCSQADEACPFIAGAEKRISVPYEDPKKWDDTPQQVPKYQERSVQIAVEMIYVFSKITL